MILTQTRRHTPKCTKKDEVSKLSRKQQAVFRACQCPCYFHGTWGGRNYGRTSLGVNNWKEGERLLQAKMLATTLTDAVAPDLGKNDHLPLSDALERWYQMAVVAQRAPRTIEHYRMLGRELLATVGEHAMLRLIDSEAIMALQARWIARAISNDTHRSYLKWLVSFFRYAKEKKWIADSPMPPRREWPPEEDIEEEGKTLPLDLDGTQTNYRAILNALAAPRAVRNANGGRKIAPLRASAAHLIAVCELMYESGLRISDAVMFEPAKLKLDSEVAVYTFKPVKTRRMNKKCTTFVPLWLVHKIRGLACLSPGLPFYDKTTLGHGVRQELKIAGAACGIGDVRPHRFRDSFAVNLMIAGVDIKIISKYLGHSSIATTEKYYAPWVEGCIEVARRKYLESRRAMQPNDGIIVMPRKQA